ncbi:MAG: hypothetical protein ACE5EH_08075 [Gammaproteobacteria bacterium]
MGRPTDDEFKIALAEAGRMREHGNDPKYLAKSLLNLNYRQQYLEDVLRAAEVYLRSGNGTSEHAKLVRVIELYRRAETRSSGEDEASFE